MQGHFSSRVASTKPGAINQNKIFSKCLPRISIVTTWGVRKIKHSCNIQTAAKPVSNVMKPLNILNEVSGHYLAGKQSMSVSLMPKPHIEKCWKEKLQLKENSQAGDHSCKHETTGYFYLDVRTFSSGCVATRRRNTLWQQNTFILCVFFKPYWTRNTALLQRTNEI